MASNTNNLGLLKKDPVADGNDTFNVRTMLNDNWDKIDEFAGKTTPISKGGTGATTAAQALSNLGAAAVSDVGNLHVWERVQSGVTDYLTSTDRNAYPDNVTDAQDAYYTFGDVVTGSFYMGIPAGWYTNIYTYSSSLSVSDDGAVSLANPSNVTSSRDDLLSTDAINSTLVGKFVQWTCQDQNSLDTKYPFNASPSPIIFIPSDAKITVTTPDVNERFTLSKYQPVTGHAAIPANTTIEYLGKLGDKARVQVVSYVGTGTYGEDNPTVLNFSFVPKVFFVGTVNGYGNAAVAGCDWINTSSISGTIIPGYVRFDGKKVFMYAQSNSMYYNAKSSYNYMGYKYIAVAIG